MGTNTITVRGLVHDEKEQDRFRRIHLQNYTQGLVGFCIWCRVGIRNRESPSHFRKWKCGRCGKQTLMVDVENYHVYVMTKDGEKLETTPDGWRRMNVRGEEVYTKSVTSKKGPQPVVLHRIEAAQLGIVVEQAVPDSTSALPSWYEVVNPYDKKKAEARRPPVSTFSTIPLTTPIRMPTAPPKQSPSQGMSVSSAIDSLDMSARISEEAKRLFNAGTSPDDLRKRHVTMHPKPSGLTEGEKVATKEKVRTATKKKREAKKSKKVSKKSKK